MQTDQSIGCLHVIGCVSVSTHSYHLHGPVLVVYYLKCVKWENDILGKFSLILLLLIFIC